jgi:hypothetical protein
MILSDKEINDLNGAMKLRIREIEENDVFYQMVNGVYQITQEYQDEQERYRDLIKKINYDRVKKWMQEYHADYIDSCNETDHTGLAEAAAEEFDLYENDSEATIPEWIFDLAAEFD